MRRSDLDFARASSAVVMSFRLYASRTARRRSTNDSIEERSSSVRATDVTGMPL